MMMSALSYQVNMNNFLSLLVGASLVTANSSPNHDISSMSQPTEFSNGVSSFALPAEDRMPFETSTFAYLNYSYVDAKGHLIELGGNENAKYGEGRVLNKTGILVHISNSANSSDHTGCSKNLAGTRGEPLPERHISWIALIRRGSCNFEDKVKHAYDHGAAGVIIYNDKNETKLDKMRINEKERNITAVFTTNSMGNELIEVVEVRGFEVVMHIIEGSRQFRTIANINRTSVLFVSISFIVLMIISLVWLVFYYVQRFRYLQTKDKQSKRLCSVAKRIIAKIPTKSIKSDDKEIDNDCCAICIEPYKVTDVIRVLPCKHEFHKSCIDPWLLEHRTCPMCKMDILKHYGFVVGSSTSQINAAITEYLNVTPPPPPSNTSTITASSIASVEDSSRIVSWSEHPGVHLSTASAARDNLEEIGPAFSGNSYSTSFNLDAAGDQLNDVVTIIINIDDNENSNDAAMSRSNGVVGGDDNTRMCGFCDFSTQREPSSARMDSNFHGNSNCDSSNIHTSNSSESTSKSHLIRSQESILQLDMDMEEGELIDDHSSIDAGYQRRNSVSPLPQIRASNENQISPSSSELDSDQDQLNSMPSHSSDHNTVHCNNGQNFRHPEAQDGRDICVGCLAAALNTTQRNLKHDVTQNEEIYATDPCGSTSLPATLKKYKGNHSTGSCRGIHPANSYVGEDNRGNAGIRHNKERNSHERNSLETQSKLPFKLYKTDRGQVRKVRTPLQNLLPQSMSAPCDNESSLHICIREAPAHQTESPSSTVVAAKVKAKEIAQLHTNHYPVNSKRRCSLSRNQSCSSVERKDVITCEDVKLAIDYSNEDDASDVTEPNSDNDLIVRRPTRTEASENKKK